jgi:deazaflavin-dependent oxidoreductase (nitroreductase family)
MPSDFQLKTMNRIHRVLLKVSFGKVGWEAMGMPVIELTTIGRKSGQPRMTMLTSPLQEGDKTMIVASRGGDDHHPAWFLNLRDNPNVEAKIGGGPKQKMIATIPDAAERSRLWAKLSAAHKNYADYQANTDREIPVVVLTPATN